MKIILHFFALILFAVTSSGADHLPQVLIIADSVHRATANTTASTLKGCCPGNGSGSYWSGHQPT